MALYGRDLLLPLNGHLDGTSGGAGLKAALCTGKPKCGALPTSADKQSLTSKPVGEACRGEAHHAPVVTQSSDD